MTRPAQMSSSTVSRIEHTSPSLVVSGMRSWYDSMSPPDRVTVDLLLQHTMTLLAFQVPAGFVDDIHVSCYAYVCMSRDIQH